MTLTFVHVHYMLRVLWDAQTFLALNLLQEKINYLLIHIKQMRNIFGKIWDN